MVRFFTLCRQLVCFAFFWGNFGCCLGVFDKGKEFVFRADSQLILN